MVAYRLLPKPPYTILQLFYLSFLATQLSRQYRRYYR